VLSAPAFADEPVVQLSPVQVTATRTSEAVDMVPASVSVVSGEELRARGARDLRTALALVAGVEGTPTGDGGPAGSVPALWGLREVDSFLLVIDGVPSGGAFNPQTPAVDLVGVERIEIVRGAAPVMYGAVSFNGVIHIIHYGAGSMPTTLTAGFGSHGRYEVTGTTTLPSLGDWKQSVSATVEDREYSVDRMDAQRYHALYRGAAGGFHLDAEVSVLPQTPGNVIFRNGAQLRTDLIPIDANHNPSDAKLDQNRYALTGGYERAIGASQWSTTVSFAYTKDEIVRGFLRSSAPTPDAEGNDADGYRQERELTDVYFDTHLTSKPMAGLTVDYGVDALFGKGEQESEHFAYFVSLDGKDAPNSHTRPIEEENESEDERKFAGAYVQAHWQLNDAWTVLAGLRLNHTEEEAEGEDDSTTPPSQVAEKADKTRLAGVIGTTWRIWQAGADTASLYADYRDTFKPLAVDFGPESEADILEPETAQSYEVGARGLLAGGAFDWDFSLFQMDFKNGRTFDAGVPVNGGEQRFRGAEVETGYHLTSADRIQASYAYHDARFVDLTLDDGTSVDGHRLEMSPYHLAGLGLMHTPTQGVQGAVVANYAGERNLNKRSTAHAGGYTTVDATLGYHQQHWTVALSGYNLGDKRVPVAESELSEVVAGASSYYMLPGREWFLSVGYEL
jgi:iron complex outermembrane receptor protein